MNINPNQEITYNLDYLKNIVELLKKSVKQIKKFILPKDGKILKNNDYFFNTYEFSNRNILKNMKNQ